MKRHNDEEQGVSVLGLLIALMALVAVSQVIFPVLNALLFSVEGRL